LVGGQPFLTRRAFDILAREESDVQSLFASADREDGPFGDHLKRVLVSVTQLPFVWEALRHSVSHVETADSRGVQRLVAAGILVPKEHGFGLPCELYRRFLTRHFASEGSSKPAAVPTSSAAVGKVSAANVESKISGSVNEMLLAELVRLRKKRKLGQATVAEALGLSQARISQIENMKGRIPLDTLLTFAKAVGANLMIGPGEELRIREE